MKKRRLEVEGDARGCRRNVGNMGDEDGGVAPARDGGLRPRQRNTEYSAKQLRRAMRQGSTDPPK